MFAYGITAILLCSLTVCYLAPVGSVLDNSSDLWLLKEYEETPPSQQSPPLSSRRITPKSIFIVPIFSNNCQQGFQLDLMGQCVKIVTVDEKANMNVLLQKLKFKFPGANQNRLAEPKETSSSGSNAEQPSKIETAFPEIVSGPFQLPIPLNANSTNDEDELVGVNRNETFVNSSTNSTDNFESIPRVITTTAESVPTEFKTGEYVVTDSTTLSSAAETTVVIDTETEFSAVVDQNTEPIETTAVFDTISPELIGSTEIIRLSTQQRFRIQSTTTMPDSTTTPRLPDEATLFQDDILKTSAIKFPSVTTEGRTNVSDETRTVVRNRQSPFASDTNLFNNGNVVFSDSDNKNNAVSVSSKGDNRELPTRGVAVAGTKCDPASGYDPDCSHESVKVQMPAKKPYPINKQQFTTYIRFPGIFTGGGSSFIRFPAGVGHTSDGMQYDTGSRLWPVNSNHYSTSYWPSWDSTKPHFVRVWPDAASAVNPYHNGRSHSHSIDLS